MMLQFKQFFVNPFLLSEMMTQVHLGKLEPFQGAEKEQSGMPGLPGGYGKVIYSAKPVCFLSCGYQALL
jgi:hypothetical protein